MKGLKSTQKKLTLDPEKKQVLNTALQTMAARLDPEMRRIYEDTMKQVRLSGDRIYLTEAQVSICKASLATRTETDHTARDILRQLTMTRKDYTTMNA